ncbi:hypothetical protein OUZ56_007939 [Daphnia magna]|uniref:Secreted protein n=1 Tax=Daphnia magna TaxID=35525 RepID=A0ABR0ABI0_9CRUS|nr:hypothetical protein OUZ56_007939 [Daphnia magna]
MIPMRDDSRLIYILFFFAFFCGAHRARTSPSFFVVVVDATHSVGTFEATVDDDVVFLPEMKSPLQPRARQLPELLVGDRRE